jgi:DNA polymerase-3 subunit beta
VDDLLTIGVFAQGCGLARSALRFYDECGLLRPVSVDGTTGYRHYEAGQLEVAVLIRRLRAMDMPVEQVRAFLDSDLAGRRMLLDAHIAAAEQRLRDIRESADRVAASLDAARPAATVGCVLSGSQLASAIAQVVFAVGTDPARPELHGVLFEVKDDTLRLVATDSYRLAIRDLIPDRESLTGPLRVLVAADLLRQLPADLSTIGRCVLSAAPDDGLRVDLDGSVLDLAPLGGEFPDYERVLLGTPTGHHCVVGRHLLEEAIGQLDSSPARLGFTAGELQIGSDAGRSSVPTSWDGPALTVTINPAFVADAVGAHLGPDVAIEAVDALRPVTFRSADDGTLSVLVMPIRTEP